MARGSSVTRPLRSGEYEVVFGTREAEKGWMDLCATARGAAVDAWEFLTGTPRAEGDRCYRLRGDLEVVTVDGAHHDRWQYKATGGGRLWYSVLPAIGRKIAGIVVLERVTTGHPNETIRVHR